MEFSPVCFLENKKIIKVRILIAVGVLAIGAGWTFNVGTGNLEIYATSNVYYVLGGTAKVSMSIPKAIS